MRMFQSIEEVLRGNTVPTKNLVPTPRGNEGKEGKRKVTLNEPMLQWSPNLNLTAVLETCFYRTICFLCYIED